MITGVGTKSPDLGILKVGVRFGGPYIGEGGVGGGGIYLIKGYLTGHSVNNIGFRRA